MDVVWNRLQVGFPRNGCTVMDDDAGKLHQPLMTSNSEDESDDEELLLRKSQFDEGAAARRKRRRRKEDEDLGEVDKVFLSSAEPLKLLRLASKWMVSFSTVGNLLSSPKSSLPTTQMLTHQRRVENMDEVSERALAFLAIITLGFCCLLLLVVYAQTPPN